MNFVPPPYPDDVEYDFGPYHRDEVVVARASLLHSLNRENSTVWQGIKYKLGILPNGQRLRTFDPEHVWLPPDLPYLWSAPVVLHDPTVPPGSRTENRNTEETGRAEQTDEMEGGGKKGVKSEIEVTRARSSPSSSGDGVSNSASKRLSGKRSWEGHHSSDDDTPVASGDVHGDVVSQKTRKNYAAKRKAKSPSESVGTSKASIREDISEYMGESSSKRVKLDNSDEEDGDQQYEVVFQCDLCNFFSLEEAEIQQHLRQKGHYSASRYLAVREAEGGELCLVYLSMASLVRQPQHQFKEKVAACPLCYSIFPSLQRCLDHTFHNHNEDGLYSFRDIIESATFDLVKDRSVCTECGVTFHDRDLRSHVKKTQHMVSYIGEKTSQRMAIFLCPFCQVIHFNYISYKSHVFDKHAKEIPSSGAKRATYYMLGESQPGQTMLPKDPGISSADINYGDPGFRGGASKKKKQREKVKQRRLRLLPLKVRKNKKQTATHGQRLASFKAKMTERKGKKSKRRNL